MGRCDGVGDLLEEGNKLTKMMVEIGVWCVEVAALPLVKSRSPYKL